MAQPNLQDPEKFGSYQDRINKLSEKLLGLHNGLEQDRSSRFDHLNGQMKMLDERLAAAQDASTKKFNILKNQLGVFDKELDDERCGREKLATDKGDSISVLDQRMQQALQAEQQARREAEASILRHFEERTSSIKEQVAKEGEERMGTEAKLRNYLEVDIPKLYENLKEEVLGREAMEQRMLDKAMEEITHLQESVLAEKKAREDTEEAMMRMMEDILSKVQAEIDTERAERERTEESLLKLLDETCNKLFSAQQQHLY